MNLVDSSGWLEYFAEGDNAGHFASAVESTALLVVSAINCYEVYKRIAQQRDEGAALAAMAVMQEGLVVQVSADLAIAAARLALDTRLPMADSVILATARLYGATLWTQDADFEGMRGVRYFAKA